MESNKKKAKKSEVYMEYRIGIEPHVDMFKNLIRKSNDHIIRVDLNEIRELIGMKEKNKISIYMGLKYVLFDKGIFATLGKTKSGEEILIMKRKMGEDKLPLSLERIRKRRLTYNS